ncbi:MAG: choice-of-anchor tandem repeat GloVer-containing protein [Terriglobales bacterium]
MPDKKSKNLVFSSPRNWNLPIASRFVFALCFLVVMLGAQSLAQTVTDLYDFTGGADGWDPDTPMIAGPDGSLYGTTFYGGYLNCPDGSGEGCGSVYRLSPSGGQWTESTLYQFRGGKDGCCNYSTLTLDQVGNLYGVTDGGTPWNAVFQLTPGAPGKHWHFHLLYEFKGKRDGGYPLSPLFVDNSGAIYGASQLGGLNGKGCSQQFGCGAVFQLVAPAHKDNPWTVNVLYEFQGASDGGDPISMIMDSTGAIYGTTEYGGAFNKNCPLGCGVIFELFPVNGTWAYKVLYTFHGTPHRSPINLLEDASGNLYGLAGEFYGGGGDIFELSPPAAGNGPWTLSYLHRYGSTYSATNLTLGPNGTLYGDIYGDQDLNWGYIFQMTPPAQQGGAWTYTTLVNFNPLGYQNPAGVVVGLGGDLYSPLSGGGYGNGSIVSVVP